MAIPRVQTPPILDWMAVSLPGSSEEENDEIFPFETLITAVDSLKTLICNEWVLHPAVKKPARPSENTKKIDTLCEKITTNMAEIVRESESHEQQNYLEQFNFLRAISHELEKRLK